MYKLYYDHNAVKGGKLTIKLNDNDIDKTIDNGDIILKYSKEELSSIEINDFSSIVKIHCEGEIEQPAKELIRIINHILRNANLNPLEEN